MNITQETINRIESEGYGLCFYKGDSWDESIPKEADNISVSNFAQGIMGDIIYTPKKKEVTLDWFMNKVNQKSEFINLMEYCKKLIPTEGIDFYPTSYGFGIFRLFGDPRKSVENTDKFLKEKEIKFTTEFSDARWVYRFKISKSQENINHIKTLLNNGH